MSQIVSREIRLKRRPVGIPSADDFELVEVLRSSLRHLPPMSVPDGPPAGALANRVWEIDAFLSHGNRVAARRYLASHIRPTLEQLHHSVRAHLLLVAADLDAALARRGLPWA